MADGFEVGPVVAHIDQFIRSFNFTRPGLDRSLGRDLARLVAGQIATRSATERRGARDADGGDVEWRPNAPRYRARKEKAYGWGEPNYRTGQMLSLASLLGDPLVEPEVLTMVYGVGEPPDRTYSPADARSPSERKGDASVTDRQKALWSHSEDDDRPARPFYELDDDIRAAAVELVRDALLDYLAKGS